ncbi:MAG: tetratricopeptide repeat protein [Ignavibacteria bacterium]
MESILKNKMTLESVDLMNEQTDTARRSDVVLAMEIAKESITISKELQYKEGLAKATLNAGICCRLASNFEAALSYYEEAISLYREIGDRKGESRTLNSIANVYLNTSNFPKAIEYFDECIFVLESIGDIEFEATVLSNRGLACQQYGDFNSSLRNYLQSLSLLLSSKKEIPYYLYNNIGIIYLEIGNYQTALKYFNFALKMEEKGNLRLEQSYTIANIGRTYLYMEDFSNAITYLGEALIIIKKFGDRQAESQIYSNLGKSYMKMRCFPEGIKFLNRALKYYREIGDGSSVGHTLCELGELYFDLNDFIASKKLFNESLKNSLENCDEINEARTYMGLGRLYTKFLDIERANGYLEKATALAEKRSSYKELGRIYKLQYDSYMAIGQALNAKKFLNKHHDCLNKLIQMEEDNCLKTFTSIQFDVEKEVENTLHTDKESFLINSKVA